MFSVKKNGKKSGKRNKDNLDIKPLTSALTLAQTELIYLETRSWFPTPRSNKITRTSWRNGQFLDWLEWGRHNMSWAYLVRAARWGTVEKTKHQREHLKMTTGATERIPTGQSWNNLSSKINDKALDFNHESWAHTDINNYYINKQEKGQIFTEKKSK